MITPKHLACLLCESFGVGARVEHVLLQPGMFEALLDQRIGVLHEHGIHVSRVAQTGDLHPWNDRQRQACRGSPGLLERPVAIPVRDVCDVWLEFQMLGDRQAVQTVTHGLLYPNGRPDVAVREYRVGVQVEYQRAVLRRIREFDVPGAGLPGIDAAVSPCHGRHGQCRCPEDQFYQMNHDPAPSCLDLQIIPAGAPVWQMHLS